MKTSFRSLFADRRMQVVAALVLGFVLGWALLGRSGHDQASGGLGAGTAVETAAEASVWTCSMHPQIRQDGPGKCPLCGMDLIPVPSSPARAGGAGRAGAADPATVRLSPEAAALAGVRTVAAERGAPERTLRLSGRVAPAEGALRTLIAEFPGRIERLHAAYAGGVVRPGDRLFTVHSPELQAAQRELIEAARLRAASPNQYAGLHAAARERLRQWGIPDARIDAIEASGEPLPALDVHARHGGTILERRVAVGDYVGRGDPLYTLADLGRVWILLDAYEQDLPWIRAGDSVSFTAASLPGRRFRGTVAFVDPVVDARTRAARVRLEVENPKGASDPVLRPEVSVMASVRSPVAGAAGAYAMVRVPATAVLWTGPRSVVYVRDVSEEAPVFRMREVTLGPRAGEFQFITEGLSAGEEVVAQGAFAVDAAAQLAGGRSMMSRPAAPERVETSGEFLGELGAVVDAYLAWKDALVAADAAAARRHARALHRSMDGVETSGVPGEIVTSWRRLHQAVAAAAATGSLDAQRERFQAASDALIALLEKTGSPRGRLNVDWCPMADDDRGAFWLSAEEGIRNPYFGDAMLRCGETRRVVPETAPPARSNPPGEGPRAPSGHTH